MLIMQLILTLFVFSLVFSLFRFLILPWVLIDIFLPNTKILSKNLLIVVLMPFGVVSCNYFAASYLILSFQYISAEIFYCLSLNRLYNFFYCRDMMHIVFVHYLEVKVFYFFKRYIPKLYFFPSVFQQLQLFFIFSLWILC